jgi:hypothetical protein
MEHIVYCDAKAQELSALLTGRKCMLIRGAMGRKTPYGRVSPGETLYLVENDATCLIRAKGTVTTVFNSDRLTPDASIMIVEEHRDQLQLTPLQQQRWYGKRYLCLITVKDIEEIEPFAYIREKNMDDWIIVESIDEIRA